MKKNQSVANARATSPECHPEKDKTAGNSGKLEKTVSDIIVTYSTLALAVIGIVTLYFLGRQLKEQSEAFQQGTRAYVTVVKHEALKCTSVGEVSSHVCNPVRDGISPHISSPLFIMELTFKNGGASPAKGFRFKVSWLIVNGWPGDMDKLIDGMHYQDLPHQFEHQSMLLGKDSEILAPVAIGISPEQLLELRSNHLLALTIGEAEYMDIFGKLHRTRLCFFYNAAVDNSSPCPIGNKMD